MTHRALATLLLAAWATASQAGTCVTSLTDLRLLTRDAAFPLRWTEISMSDGKPLVVTIAERDGALFLMFHKTGEGLWAEGPVQVCGKEGDLQARIPENLLRVGPAAHWIVRRALRNDARFSLRRDSTGQLAIATAGWSSQFTASGD